MSRGLKNFPEQQIASVATRRITADTHGIGYLGAIDFFNKKHLHLPGRAGMMQNIQEAYENAIFDENGFTQGQDARDQRYSSSVRDSNIKTGESKRRGHSGRSEIRVRKANSLALSALRSNISHLEKRGKASRNAGGVRLGDVWPGRK